MVIMKRQDLKKQQIVKAVQKHENGGKAEDICRELGFAHRR